MAGETRVRHVRVSGWCQLCGGHGRVAFDHWDVPDIAGVSEVGDLDQVAAAWTSVLRLIAKHVHTLAAVRLTELERLSGCEAGAAKSFEQGRLQVVEHDMWEAVGLPAPEGDW